MRAMHGSADSSAERRRVHRLSASPRARRACRSRASTFISDNAAAAKCLCRRDRVCRRRSVSARAEAALHRLWWRASMPHRRQRLSMISAGRSTGGTRLPVCGRSWVENGRYVTRVIGGADRSRARRQGAPRKSLPHLRRRPHEPGAGRRQRRASGDHRPRSNGASGLTTIAGRRA